MIGPTLTTNEDIIDTIVRLKIHKTIDFSREKDGGGQKDWQSQHGDANLEGGGTREGCSEIQTKNVTLHMH